MNNVKMGVPFMAALVSSLFINSSLLTGSVAGFVGIYTGFIAVIWAINFSKF